MQRDMNIAVIDDDLLTQRGAMAVFESDPGFSRSVALTLEEALGKHRSYWQRFDRIFVDVYDKAREMREPGTDVYTGVAVIEAIQRSGFAALIVAMTPTKANPLLAERLKYSGVHYVYERWDFQCVEDLIDAVRNPCDLARPKSHSARVLLEEGLGRWSNPNRAVEVFKASPLYGKVLPNMTQTAIGSRRAAMRLRDEVAATGFVGTGQSPRWNEVRDYLLKLTGRIDVEDRRPPV